MTSIITGDIIDSRTVNVDEWLTILKESFNTVGTSPKNWEIFRGDSFQIEIEDVKSSLLFALRLKTSIKKIKKLDVRLAIGIGKKGFDGGKITEANGEAFINSGYVFDNLLKKQSLAIKSPFEEFDSIMNTSLALALLIMDNWTVNSAEFVEKCLLQPNVIQKIIAKELQISESSASERRKRAGLDEILRLESLYRELINKKITY